MNPSRLSHKAKFFRFRITFIPRISHLILVLLTNLLVILPFTSAADESSTPTGKQFIQDVQQLLLHNQQFYNKYGTSDHLINLKFFEARDAAEEIFHRPDIFAEKVNSLQKLINAKVSTFSSLQEHLKLDLTSTSASSSGRVNSIVPDRVMLVLASTIGGFAKIKK